MYNFVNPYWFFLLCLIPLIILYDLYAFKKIVPKIFFPNLSLLKKIQKRNSFLKYLPLVLKTLLIVSISIALARPRASFEKREYTTYGVDIILCIDISGSMQAVDFRPKNRMEAAKEVAMDFIRKRENDRIGIVTFAAFAYTLVPLTNDFKVLNTVVSNIDIERYKDGTAIGNGLAISTRRLIDSPAESKVIILLTDGVNNTGQIDPIQASEIAASFGIRIYAVGIGTKGLVDFPFPHPILGTQYRKVNIDFDIDQLNDIARIGGTGRAAIASNTLQLQAIFEEIDTLEKTEIRANIYYEYQEMFIYFLYAAAILLTLLLLLNLVFRISLP
jgi:Ca-activated chloride channel family protein